VEVSEEEIADAKAMIGRDGIGCEPASAATLAGIRQLAAAGRIDRDEDVVAILTGNLMKDPTYTIDYHLGALYEEKETRTEVVRAAGKLAGQFANPPRPVPADKELIKQMLGLDV
jgi:threonine synthase